MRDLKHLIYFEKLIQNCDNVLIDQARSDGQICIGNLCYQMPEVLLNLPGCFSVRLRAPNTSSMEMGTYYMTSFDCEYCRALLERSLEGGFGFLDCIIEPYACSQMATCAENIEVLCADDRPPHFFVQHMDTPMKADENAVKYLSHMCRVRALDRLHGAFGIDTSDAALREAVERHNRLCRVITAIGEYRKLPNPPITGYEFAVVCLVSYSCPHDLVLEKLEETLKELQTRRPDPKPTWRVRVVLAGSAIDDPHFIKTIEDAGALVVADRYCTGSFPGRTEIRLDGEGDLLTQICRHYVMQCQCPRYMDTARVNQRKNYLALLARDYNADGIVIQQMSFCNFWAYERVDAINQLQINGEWPILSVDRPYVVGQSGQMRTRIQAFVESIEIKKLQKGITNENK